MSHSEGAGIRQAIIAVMREVGAIGKDAMNEQQKYPYRSAEQVYNRVQPLFAKHGIFSVPKVIDQKREMGTTRNGGTIIYSMLTVEYSFYAEDGSCITATVVGEGMDGGDKASSKALTAAHKYAICQLLNLPYAAEDPEKHTPEFFRKMAGKITQPDMIAIKRKWHEKIGRKLPQDTPREKLAECFREWVCSVVGRDFDAIDFRQWTAEELELCEKELEEHDGDDSEMQG